VVCLWISITFLFECGRDVFPWHTSDSRKAYESIERGENFYFCQKFAINKTLTLWWDNTLIYIETKVDHSCLIFIGLHFLNLLHLFRCVYLHLFNFVASIMCYYLCWWNWFGFSSNEMNETKSLPSILANLMKSSQAINHVSLGMIILWWWRQRRSLKC
jgi:hypothetical protein